MTPQSHPSVSSELSIGISRAVYYRSAVAATAAAILLTSTALAQSPSTGNTAPWTGGGPPSKSDPTKFPTPPSSPHQPHPSRPSRPVVIYPSRPNHVHVYGQYSWDHWGYQDTSRRYYDSLGNAYTIEQRCTRPYPTRGWSYDGSCWFRYVRIGSGLSFGGYGPDPSINYYGVSPNVSYGPYTQYVGSDGRTYISVPTDPAPAAPTTYDYALDAIRAKQTTQAIKELTKHLKEVAADASATPDLRSERLLAVMYLENSEFSEAMSRLALAYRRMPTLANEPLDAADLGIESARLRELVVKSVRYANRMNTGSAWLMVTILMQAEGRNDLALTNLAKAESVGLDAKLVAALRSAMTPVQDPPAVDPPSVPPAAPALPPAVTPGVPATPNTTVTPAPTDRQE